MGCDCLTGMVRIIMFIINVCVWITGAGLLGIGIWMLVDASSFDYLFKEDTLTVVAIITVTSGALMFLVGFCGCCGAMKGNKCLLSTYVAILMILTVAMFASGITALVYLDEVEGYLEENIQNIIKDDYGNKDAATGTIDSLQNDFDCCGSKEPADWLNSSYYKNEQKLPESCCVEGDLCVGAPYPFTNDTVWQEGCYDSFNNWVNDHIGIIAGVSLGFIVVLILAMVFGCCMVKDKTEYV